MEERKFRVSDFIHGADYNPDQWLEHSEVIDEDFRMFPLAGMTSLTIGMFSWKRLEPEEGKYCFDWLDAIMDRMAENGMKVILGTPTGARPAWMDRKYPEIMRVSPARVRNLHGLRHNHCKQSPYYRKKTREINGLLAKRYQKHPALYMWHVNNEYQGECHCELCQQAFREWLREKYHNDIEELNREWCTDVWSHGFGSFEEIESPSERGENLIHGMNLDWRRFVTAQTLSFFINECEPLREYTPDIPITTNYMGQNSDFDHWKLAPYMDIMSWDSYPEWGMGTEQDIAAAEEAAFYHDRLRTMKDQPFLVMECTPSQINWRRINKLKKPGMHELSAVHAIAHGADSIQYFQWRKCRGEAEKLHGAVVDHYGREDTRVFRDVSRVGQLLKTVNEAAGSDTIAYAAVMYDWENFWAIDDLQGWRRPRLYEETVRQHHRALRRLGMNVDVIQEESALDKYRIVAAPMLYMLRADIAERMKAFVKSGGILILTYGTGQVNENDLCFLGGFPGGGLRELTGLWAEEMDVLYDEERNGLRLCGSDCRYAVDSYCELVHPDADCDILGTYTEDFYAGNAAVTRKSYGKGECYYIAARTEQAFLDDFYKETVKKQESVLVWDGLDEGIEVTSRSKNKKEYCFLMNFTEEKKEIALPDGWKGSERLTDKKTVSDKICLDRYGYMILCRRVEDGL